jgi:serine/threonine protein phosphatase PrpC
MEYITYSHIGKRKSNEDLVLVKELNPNTLLAIIADGMGGYEYGGNAAKIVVESISDILMRDKLNNAHDLEFALATANSKVREFNTKFSIRSGATIGGAVIQENITKLFWVGDVRIDIYKNNRLLFRSSVHTLIEDLKKQLKVVPMEMIEKYSHIVTNSISGKDEKITYGYQELPNTDYDYLIISSDGVYQKIDPFQLLEKRNNSVNLYLIENANDNNSYILVRK